MLQQLDLRQVFLTCTLCPGICISRCPVYMTSRIRASAPHVIGRSGFRLLMGGPREEALNLYLCSGCGGCMDACPISNPLPEAIRKARFKLGGVLEARIEPVYIGGSGEKILVVSPLKPRSFVDAAIREGYNVSWLNSRGLTIAYWSGIDVDLGLEGFSYIVSEDRDLPLSSAANPLEAIKDLGLTARKLNGYTLHIPCKERGDIEGLASDILGEPKSVIYRCSGGGGGMLELARDYSLLVASGMASEGPIVTTCRWAQMAMEASSVEAYTILDLVV